MEQDDATVERINKQRNYWMNKMEAQLSSLMLASIDGDMPTWEKIKDDLETSAIILWRFDRKLHVHVYGI